jgi:hypothetical protein
MKSREDKKEEDEVVEERESGKRGKGNIDEKKEEMGKIDKKKEEMGKIDKKKEERGR